MKDDHKIRVIIMSIPPDYKINKYKLVLTTKVLVCIIQTGAGITLELTHA